MTGRTPSPHGSDKAGRQDRPGQKESTGPVWRPTGSLSRRITWMVAITAAASMLTGSLVSVWYNVYELHSRTIASAEAPIDNHADTAIAALNLRDPVAAAIIARRVANASGAMSVELIDESGATLARHERDAAAPPARAEAPERPSWLSVALSYLPEVRLPSFRHRREVRAYGSHMGQYVLEFSSAPLVDAALAHLRPFAALSVVAALLAILVTGRMRRQISRPITNLLETMDYVARTQDYSPHVKPDGPDEVGSLIVGFNEMLHQIHSRNLHLADHRRKLQELVIERTRNFEAAAREAEQSSRAKGDFLARMSHEIRTPMNGVVGMAELLESTALEQSQQRMLNTMRSSADALLEIINDILDFSKIEAGQLQVLNTDFGVHELMEEVCDLLASKAHERGLELVCAVDGKVPTHASGDPIRLRQIVTNLLGNAIKYTEEGQVVLRVTAPEVRDDGVELRIEVEDTGLGIPADQLENIFQAFTQGQSFETRKHGGTGLGLAITKQLVTILNGEIDVESTVGAGSRFWVDLPFGKPQHEHQEKTDWSLEGVTVLIVHHNETAAAALSALLEAAGARVWSARTGQRALERLELDDFNLVIADSGLPDMNVSQLLDALRSSSSSATLPLVMMQTATGTLEGHQVPNVAPDAVLIKPVRRLRMREAIDRALGRAGENATETEFRGRARRNLGLKVLLVEDSPVNREVATGMLEALGCTVETAGDGSVGVECALGRSYDVILMDCQMPLMDGFEATRRIRAGEQAASRPMTPIVALTANALPGDRERCLLSGMNEFISKPFTLSKLQDVLSDVTRTEGTVVESPERELAAPRQGPEPDGQGSVLDSRQIEELRALGRPQIIVQAIDIFRKQADEKLAELDQAIKDRDPGRIEQAAHALKSSSLSVGGRRFANAASLCEQAARAGDVAAAAREARALQPELTALSEALTSLQSAECAA